MADRTLLQAKKHLIDRIVKVRGERSQRRFARDLGVFQQNVNRYESGDNLPHFDFLVTVATKEGVSLDWLMLGRGKMHVHGAQRVSNRRQRFAA